MFEMEKAFANLLEGNVTYDDEAVQIIQGYSQIDETPCITIQQVAESFVNRRYVEINNIQNIQKTYDSTIWINIWCNTNKQRNLLIEQVQNRILQAEANHYSTCQNFNNGECNVLDSECEALNRNSNSSRVVKNQCPLPDIYTPFFQTYHIKKNTFCIDSITDADELDIGEPILRSIFSLNMNYDKYYPIGGTTFEKIDLGDDLL